MDEMVVDSRKVLSQKIPFYAVIRDEWGWVRQCAKPTSRRCGKCIMKKRCLVRGGKDAVNIQNS
jgi:hypothetical protein